MLKQRMKCWRNLPIVLDHDTPSAAAVFSLALRYDLTSYDATYLELALHLQLPIATQDTALIEAARASGVGPWQITAAR